MFVPIDDPALDEHKFSVYENHKELHYLSFVMFLSCLVGTCNFSDPILFIYNSSDLDGFSNCNQFVWLIYLLSMEKLRSLVCKGMCGGSASLFS